MKTRSLSRLFTVSIIVCNLTNIGCESEEAESSQQPFQDIAQQETTVAALTENEMETLAQRYLNEKMGIFERKETLEKIRSLSSSQSSKFFYRLKDIQLKGKDVDNLDSETQTMIEIGEALNRRSIAKGISRLRLTKNEIDESIGSHYGLDEFQLVSFKESSDLKIGDRDTHSESDVAIATLALCILPYVSCSTTTYAATAYGASCGLNCINGSSYDRVSNEVCELGACDHRIFYPSSSRKNAVDGKTSAADCVINYYGGIINRWQNGYTQLGYGIAGPAYCGILLNVSEYLRDNTQVF